jgi:hypothetical protein
MTIWARALINYYNRKYLFNHIRVDIQVTHIQHSQNIYSKITRNSTTTLITSYNKDSPTEGLLV